MARHPTQVMFPKTASSFTRISYWGGNSFNDEYCQIDARRLTYEGKDEAQIEMLVVQTKVGGGGARQMIGSMILSPDEARTLALAICPELAPK